MAIGLVANMFWANFDRIFSSKWFYFIRDFMGENALQRLDEYEAKKRKLTVGAAKRTKMGLTHMEIAVAIAGALLIGIASWLALRQAFALNTVFLYIVTGGVAITVHEMGHRFAAHHHEVLTEVKFWEIGTVIMFFTGWLAGNVFAQPHRTVVEEKDEEDHHIDGKISLAGPLVSICLGILVVPFLFVGGDITKIASTLLMMTLLVALYHLMPFGPMDGKAVYRWSKVVLLATIVPLFIIYYYLFLL